MGVFRNKDLKNRLCPVIPTFQKVRKDSVSESGVKVCTIVMEELDTKIPSPSKYRLHDLLDAGIALNPVSVNVISPDGESAETIVESLKIENNE